MALKIKAIPSKSGIATQAQSNELKAESESSKLEVKSEELRVKSDSVESIEQSEAPSSSGKAGDEVIPMFGPIPYSVIVDRWWKDVKGRVPYVGERHASLLDLCKNLAYITEFNRDLLLRIMPRLDKPEKEIEGIVDDTLKYVNAHKSTKIPYSMYNLVKKLEQEYEAVTPLNGECEDDDDDNETLPLWGSKEGAVMPTEIQGILPPGIKEFVQAAPQKLKTAYCHSLLVEWATMATRIRATYLNGESLSPSLECCVVGEPASGKSLVKSTSYTILAPLIAQDKRMEELEDEWDDAVKQKGGGAKDMPLRPKLPLLYNDGDVTAPEILNRLKFNKGVHFIICSDEIDSLTKSRYADWKVMSEFLRKAFDNSRWGQQRAGSNAVRGHADVYCNLLTACTEDRLHYYFDNHVKNGLVSRVIFSPIKSSLGEEMPAPVILKPAALKRIKALQEQAIAESHSVTETTNDDGTPNIQYEVMPERVLNMKFLNEALSEWLTAQALLCRKEGSKARDQFRKRAAVVAFRCGMVAFWLWGARHTAAIKSKVKEFALWMADNVLYNQLTYFAHIVDKKETEQKTTENRTNFAEIYDALSNVFDSNNVTQMLESKGKASPASVVTSMWKQSNLIRKFNKRFYKIGSPEEQELDKDLFNSGLDMKQD